MYCSIMIATSSLRFGGGLTVEAENVRNHELLLLFPALLFLILLLYFKLL